jgi:hypothetical protein
MAFFVVNHAKSINLITIFCFLLVEHEKVFTPFWGK